MKLPGNPFARGTKASQGAPEGNRGQKVFYGWYIVGGTTVAITATTAFNAYIPSLMLVPMSADLGWNRTSFFAIQSLSAVVAGITAPFVGRRVDRGNPRLLILTGSLMVTASISSYSQIRSLWLYALLAGVVTPVSMSLCSTQVFNAIVGKWFVRKRGRAVSIATLGSNLAGIVFPPATVALVAAFGWRMTWMSLGLIFAAVVAPMALVVRRSPEDMGLHADGEPLLPPGDGVPVGTQEREWGWRQLLRTRTFWILALNFGVSGMAMQAVWFHGYPFFTGRSLSPAVAASMFTVSGTVAIITRPIWARIFEKWDLRRAAALTYLIHASVVVGMLVSPGAATLYAVMVVSGIGSGGFPALPPMLWGHYFGRRSLGQVLGLSQMIGLPFVASGATVSARMFDLLHNYTAVFSVAAGMLVICSVIVCLVRPPPAPIKSPVVASQVTLSG